MSRGTYQISWDEWLRKKNEKERGDEKEWVPREAVDIAEIVIKSAIEKRYGKQAVTDLEMLGKVSVVYDLYEKANNFIRNPTSDAAKKLAYSLAETGVEKVAEKVVFGEVGGGVFLTLLEAEWNAYSEISNTRTMRDPKIKAKLVLPSRIPNRSLIQQAQDNLKYEKDSLDKQEKDAERVALKYSYRRSFTHIKYSYGPSDYFRIKSIKDEERKNRYNLYHTLASNKGNLSKEDWKAAQPYMDWWDKLPFREHYLP